MRKLANNKKGSFSILFIILCFIAVIVLSGFVTVTKKAFSINEVQGIMDNAGVSALRAGVDENEWRVETLSINETVVKNTFNKLIQDTVKTDGAIVSYDIRPTVIAPNSSSLASLGIPRGEREQYFLVAEARLRCKSEPILDQITVATLDYFNMFSGAGEQIRYEGVAEDGYTEIVVRSVSRLVLR